MAGAVFCKDGGRDFHCSQFGRRSVSYLGGPLQVARSLSRKRDAVARTFCCLFEERYVRLGWFWELLNVI